MSNSTEKPHFSTPKPTTTTETTTELDDWDTPFTNEQLEAIEAAFEAATAQSQSEISTPSTSSFKTPRHDSEDNENARPKTRRRLPGSIISSNAEMGSAQNSGSCSNSKSGPFPLVPCPKNLAFRQASVKMRYPAMNFSGRIVYSRTAEEVEEATLQISKLLEAKKQELGRAILGLDIEWRPSFDQGIPQGKAAVMQICGDMTHCYVLHIIHSGIPHSLRSLLEDSTSIKVGVGIDNDTVKVFHDHNVSIKLVEDLSSLANQKLGGVPKQWSLSKLVETLTCKQLLKPKRIRLGNWEARCLSKPQLQYAATDAFASWYLYEVLNSFPDISENQNES